MPLKGHGRKDSVKGSSSKTLKGALDENLPINIPIQTSSIPKASTKTFIDGIPFNAFLVKFYKDLYSKSYLKSSLFGIGVKATPEVVAKVLGIPLVEAPSIEGALGIKKKVCHHRAKIQIGATNVFLEDLFVEEAKVELGTESKCALEEEDEKPKVKVLVKWSGKDWLA
ncbi:hypothetical protein CK203_109401 [Vitis vinifera]|uniref:Uncharacterized protein n=1 Tax=Vitis vinifera TaxID=29760 RepID=A0A438BQM8_VITVI|nr:hypothetical protein CK203_109401 [Vitis vinifera]